MGMDISKLHMYMEVYEVFTDIYILCSLLLVISTSQPKHSDHYLLQMVSQKVLMCLAF